jgi:hypothetical protein
MAGKRIGVACSECGAVVALKREARAVPRVEVGCTDWYLYPLAEWDAADRVPVPADELGAAGRRIDPGPRAWVKRPVDV